EGAMLAALPKAPSVYTPRRNVARARQRRNLVLGLMSSQGYLTTTQAAQAEESPLKISETEWHPSVSAEPGALDAVRAPVDSVKPDFLKEGAVTVYRTLDFSLQRAADKSMTRHIASMAAETRETMGGRTDDAQGALVALDPQSGDIRALVP